MSTRKHRQSSRRGGGDARDPHGGEMFIYRSQTEGEWGQTIPLVDLSEHQRELARELSSLQLKVDERLKEYRAASRDARSNATALNHLKRAQEYLRRKQTLFEIMARV